MLPRKLSRRRFVRTALEAGVAATALGRAPAVAGKVLGANDRINVGLIGSGSRGRFLLRWIMETGGQVPAVPPPGSRPDATPPAADPALAARVVAVCDVYAKRRKEAAKLADCEALGDYRALLDRADVDAVVIATPDHWHARMAIEALEKGKDVYLEKPVTLTIDEAREVAQAVRKTGRVLQVGSNTTSSDQWWKARKAIQDGMIGKLIMSQGSYHRNSETGEWNWAIDKDAGPDAKGDDHIDWDMWLGSAPKRPFDADRFFRFRKYWDYSGGIATDLFYHVMAPLNICWGEAQFPHRVVGTGGIYVFTDGREVPDTFTLLADFPQGHSLVLSSTLTNDNHIPGLIRGHEGTIMIVPEGRFEGRVDHITVTPQPLAKKRFKDKYGTIEMKIECEPRESHMANFLRCVRTREKPVLDADTAYKAMVTIGMSVQSYREGRMLYWDAAQEKVTATPTPTPA
jgi:predicted dehydrogenase